MPDSHWRAYGAVARGGLAAVTLLFLGAADQKPEAKHEPAAHQTAAQATPSPTPTPAKNPSAQQQHGPAGPDQGPKPLLDWWSLSSESLAARATVVLTGATIILGALTGLLAFFTFRLVKDGAHNLRMARVSVRVSNRALAHARESARTSLESAHRMERAYVFGGLDENSILVSAYGWRYQVKVRNNGKTPGIVKRIQTFIFDHPPADAEGALDSQHVITDIVMAAGEMGPIGTFDYSRDTAFLAVQFDYVDIFGTPHFSRSLYKIDATKMTAVNGAIWTEFGNAYWNDWS